MRERFDDLNPRDLMAVDDVDRDRRGLARLMLQVGDAFFLEGGEDRIVEEGPAGKMLIQRLAGPLENGLASLGFRGLP